jgi:hypothetical protein
MRKWVSVKSSGKGWSWKRHSGSHDDVQDKLYIPAIVNVRSLVLEQVGGMLDEGAQQIQGESSLMGGL